MSCLPWKIKKHFVTVNLSEQGARSSLNSSSLKARNSMLAQHIFDWGGLIKTDGELRYTDLEIAFKLVGRAIA